MGGHSLPRAVHSRTGARPPPRAATHSRDHSLSIAAVVARARSRRLLSHRKIHMEQAAGPLLPRRPAGPGPQAVRRDARAGRRLLEHLHRAPLLAHAERCPESRRDRGLVPQAHAHAVRLGLRSTAFVGTALARAYGMRGRRRRRVRGDRRAGRRVLERHGRRVRAARRGDAVADARGWRRRRVMNGHCFASVLCESAALASLEHGKMVHCRVMNLGFCSDTVVGNALFDMYFKCGSSSDARPVFRTMRVRDVVSWTAMILGFGRHGEAMKAVMTFREMIHDGFRPDSVTFLAVLSACRQGGLVDEGLAIFHSMVEDHGVKPQREHCACIVDLLGHAGRLKEAEALIKAVGLEMDSLAWESLLGACGLDGAS
ncbi:hypothetical protein CFC21_108034 [Triticum aestivum]|uniref:Pentatricopeptide repeat-containing protein n=2 Tax=Triticum aestivum TaxID=4565 RepID=A0A9R1MHN7_WHEAT|nr:hypothetical protein CFC21_108034 [Triticum aestivum]